jgi:hypothetical protein
MSKTKSTVVVNHRNAITGQFVKASYVKSNPSTTTTERNRVSAPTKSSKNR